MRPCCPLLPCSPPSALGSTRELFARASSRQRPPSPRSQTQLECSGFSPTCKRDPHHRSSHGRRGRGSVRRQVSAGDLLAGGGSPACAWPPSRPLPDTSKGQGCYSKACTGLRARRAPVCASAASRCCRKTPLRSLNSLTVARAICYPIAALTSLGTRRWQSRTHGPRRRSWGRDWSSSSRS